MRYTLGELISELERAEDIRLKLGFDNPHSYRGDYCDLAFEPAENITTKEMLIAARSALGITYTGYKGGEFKMDEETAVWVSEYGEGWGETIGKILLDLLLSEGNWAND